MNRFMRWLRRHMDAWPGDGLDRRQRRLTERYKVTLETRLEQLERELDDYDRRWQQARRRPSR